MLTGEMFTEEQNELIESAAEMLYGMIHARYILTSKGLASMVKKLFYILETVLLEYTQSVVLVLYQLPMIFTVGQIQKL